MTTPLAWSTIQPRVDALLAETLDHENVERWLKAWSDLSAQLREARLQVERDVTENTADAEAEQRFLSFVEHITPKVEAAEQALKQKLLAYDGYTPTAETTQMMKRFRTEAAIFREENLALKSELLKMGNEYDRIVGGMTIQWDGQAETIPQAQQHLQDTDRATRERAWRLMMGSYAQRREKLNALYLRMLELRRQIARNADCATFREYRWQALGRFDYTPEDSFTFHDAIEHEVVPLATELYERLRAQLNVETLRPWDVEADPHGQPLAPFRDAVELEEMGQRLFQQIDPALGGYYAVMRDGYLDLASRPNKAPGAYCEGFPVAGKPYIFMSAVGSHRDVMTLLHESGHAFHFMESKAHPLIWNYEGPMEFCEVASMAMELLGMPYLERRKGGVYTEADARRGFARELRGIVFFLPYMAVVDAFQHWVYVEAPENVSATELDARWSALWDRFLPGVDYSGLRAEKESGWQRKPHIFSDPFYYIEYGLAELGALQVWRNALRDPVQAVADYRAALALGNTRPLPALFKRAGARFAFDREMVAGLMALIREQLAALESVP
jgi:oligoendopeptidase F